MGLLAETSKKLGWMDEKGMDKGKRTKYHSVYVVDPGQGGSILANQIRHEFNIYLRDIEKSIFVTMASKKTTDTTVGPTMSS